MTIVDNDLQSKLSFAESELDYFRLYREQYPDTKTLVFEFKHCLVKVSLKQTKNGSDNNDEPDVTQLTDCGVRLLHSVTDDSQKKNQQTQYHLILYSERERQQNIILTDAQLRTASAFKTALLQYRQTFYGSNKELTELVSYLFETNPPKVRALSAIGYDESSNGYFFPEFAYSTKGGEHLIPLYKYFEPSYVQPFMHCSNTVIKVSSLRFIQENVEQTQNLIYLLNKTYDKKALLMLGFYISSLFSHAVFNHYGFFPLLSLYGHPHPDLDNKRFLTRLFNRCLFIDSEGQKIKAAFTSENELKKIRQKSNLVCALLDDRGYKKQLDYDTVLPYYNRKELSSNATLAFVSDTEHFTNEVMQEFVISLQFPNTTDYQSNLTWGQLNRYTPKQLANVGDYLLTNRQHFESQLLNTISHYETILTTNGISIQRMAQNYAIALGGIVCLLQLLNHQIAINNLVNYTLQRAKHKQESTQSPVYVANYFLGLLLKHCNPPAKILTTKGELLIDLPIALKQLTALDYDFNEKALRTGLTQHPQYLSFENSTLPGTTRKLYFFNKLL